MLLLSEAKFLGKCATARVRGNFKSERSDQGAFDVRYTPNSRAKVRVGPSARAFGQCCIRYEAQRAFMSANDLFLRLKSIRSHCQY